MNHEEDPARRKRGDVHVVAGEEQVAALGTAEAKMALAKGERWDVILLGPQIGYMKVEFEKVAPGVPVEVIPPALYTMAKGKETVVLAASLLKQTDQAQS
ncbi:PTS sugar transporter subunit IIB [Streptomyces sp. NPDC059533]|uniref:PTS sugar transporter subunit IIB n=1 Tax=unclassified Streptomyces TaxID=2593676 RepID=UPI0036CC8DB1